MPVTVNTLKLNNISVFGLCNIVSCSLFKYKSFPNPKTPYKKYLNHGPSYFGNLHLLVPLTLSEFKNQE